MVGLLLQRRKGYCGFVRPVAGRRFRTCAVVAERFSAHGGASITRAPADWPALPVAPVAVCSGAVLPDLASDDRREEPLRERATRLSPASCWRAGTMPASGSSDVSSEDVYAYESRYLRAHGRASGRRCVVITRWPASRAAEGSTGVSMMWRSGNTSRKPVLLAPAADWSRAPD